MRMIGSRTLIEFEESLRGSKDCNAVKSALSSWFYEAQGAIWETTADVKSKYRKASIVCNDHIAFNIKGGDYRLVVAIDFQKHIVFIRWVGTHKKYEEIGVAMAKYGDKTYQK